MKINLPDDLEIMSRATAAGFADVDSYICHLVESDHRTGEESQRVGDVDYAEWKATFDSFLASLKPGNPDFDDSRESIYTNQ